MKQCIWILALITLTGLSALAQTPKRGNRFDTTLARKNELSITVGMSANAWRARGMGSPTFAVGYTRVFKANHFLRTGLQYLHFSYRDNDRERPFFSQAINGESPNGMPLNYTITKTQRDINVGNHYLSAFIGYEYGIGFKRFRFTFGGDLHIGYNYRELTQNTDVFQETRTHDPVTDMFSYNIQFLEYGRSRIVGHGIFVGLVPRIGIRRDFGRRVALAFTLTPQVNIGTVLATRTVSSEGTANSVYLSKGGLQMNANLMSAELRVIFKLGKN